MIIKPFKAIRPAKQYAAQVAALPYDVMNTSEAREMVKDNPHSFLHVDRSEVDLPESTDPYSDAVYAKAAENLQGMIRNGVLVSEKLPNLYVYRLIMDGREQTGLVCCVSADEYVSGAIKKHELTRADKEEDRTKHVDITNANTGPIFLTYRDTEDVDSFLTGICNNTPLYDFTADDGVRHIVWTIEDIGDIVILEDKFKLIPSLYIADGHHRNASAVNVAQQRRKQNPNSDGSEPYNYYLAVLFPHEQLKILPYNRVVKDLNGFTAEEFLSKLSDAFTVTKTDGQVCEPTVQHTFGLYINKCWYTLQAKIVPNDAVNSLDAAILQNEVLSKILNIQDIRTDKRIQFIGGIRGTDELVKLVDSGEYAAAFSMFPTSIDELMTVADEGRLMPPKSTWFEPKLRSGLFIHALNK